MSKEDLTPSHQIMNRQHNKIITQTIISVTTVNNTAAIAATVTAIDHPLTCW